ncbi:MAG: hypothetical protein ACXIT9_13680 [Nitritalea sp.]
MDAGNILYIIAIIIYFIYSAVTAGKKKQAEREQEARDAEELGREQEGPKQKTGSFEDMLREIRRAQQGAERDLERSGQGRRAADFEEEEEDDYEPLPTKREVSEETRRAQKEPSSRAFRSTGEEPYQRQGQKKFGDFEGLLSPAESKKLKTLDEQVDIDKPVERLGVGVTQIETEEKSKGTNRYKKMLRDPKTAKDAVILAEILNRKHF